MYLYYYFFYIFFAFQGVLSGGRRRGGRGQHLGVATLREPLQARQLGGDLRRQQARPVRTYLAAASGTSKKKTVFVVHKLLLSYNLSLKRKGSEIIFILN